MGGPSQFFDEIPDNVLEWIKKQEMFWVATAPLSTEGHINISPKGYKSTIHAISKNKFWYEDLTGSGVETIAHLRENKRITILFQAFEGPPRICRLFGEGTYHEYDSEEYWKYIPKDNRHPGSRAVIIVDIHKVGTSCGYAVPFYQFLSHRTQLMDIACEREKPSSKKYVKNHWEANNTRSIDGLPALKDAPFSKTELKHCWASERGKYEEANARRWSLNEKSIPAGGKGEMNISWVDRRTVVSFLLGATVATISSIHMLRN